MLLFKVTILLCGLVLLAAAGTDDEFLTIHIVPHTHDDVGWLKTVDEYYWGANNSIQEAGVQYILDSVVQALVANPARTFTYVEIAFFQRWWEQQTEATKAVVRKLVDNDQLTFTNGGWCMNDEAGTTYEGVIDQMTLGHAFLRKELGPKAVPTVGSHLDPFGHSAAQAAMFARMGFDGWIFARIDYQDYAARNGSQRLEVVMQQGDDAADGLFTHVLYKTSYGAPSGFDWQSGDTAPMQWDNRLFPRSNMKQRADEFAASMRERRRCYRHAHLLCLFGSDFHYQNAHMNFKNLDLLIDYMNANQDEYRMRLVYSSPAAYIGAVNQLNLKWEVKKDDFFPYADEPHAYWTGYFTSRASLKGYVRSRNALRHAANALAALAPSSSSPAATNLSFSLGVAQHHDAVAGTEKQHVADDYARRLAAGSVDAVALVAAVLGYDENDLVQCDYLNQSICSPLSSAVGKAVVPVVVYNPTAWQRVEFLELPVPAATGVVVANVDGTPLPPTSLQFSPNLATGYWTLTIMIDLPSFAYTTVYVDLTRAQWSKSPAPAKVGNASLHGANGYLVEYRDSRLFSIDGLRVSEDVVYYNSSSGNNNESTQPGGAYIMRPNRTEPFAVSTSPPVLLSIASSGPLFDEVRQVWSDWVHQTTRVYRSESVLRSRLIVGPIPIADQRGKEVVKRYHTSIKSSGVFYTDAQGLKMQRREYNHRPCWNLTVNEPVAGNYYPKNMAAYVEDAAAQRSTGQRRRFTLVTDRSSGAASLADGELEYNVHRRLLVDDHRGVGEPLNVSNVVLASETVVLADASASDALQRTQSSRLNHPFQLFFAPPSSSLALALGANAKASKNATLFVALPPEIQLTTIEYIKYYSIHQPNTLLVRLHYMREEGKAISVDLAQHMKAVTIESMTEVGLNGQSLRKRLHWDTTSDNVGNLKKLKRSAKMMVNEPTTTTTTLQPMEIKTFLVTLKK